MPRTRPSDQPLTEKDLGAWKLVEAFRERLIMAAPEVLEGTWGDPRRRLTLEGYLSLFLFCLFNPVVETMRGLCKASELQRVQEEVSAHRVSLGSFSEAQAVVDLDLLQEIFATLAQEQPNFRSLRRLKEFHAVVVDSSVWRLLPRVRWAAWRLQHKAQSAIRAHLKFHVWKDVPVEVAIEPARKCERAVLREHLQAGEYYVGDRNYGEEYALFGELLEKGCGFVLRLRQESAWTVLEEFPLSEADKAARVIFDGRVQLGVKKKSPVVRLVRIQAANPEGEEVRLVTSTLPADMTAAEVGELYRCRWKVELFFRWIKCTLGCRHWLAESPRGVALQVYCALIGGLLLQSFQGRRPNRREMERLQFYLMGWASEDELMAGLGLAKNQP